MKVFKLEHRGHYLGGVIIVCCENIDDAKSIMVNQLYSAGVKDESFSIDDIVEINLSFEQIIYFDNGDY